MIVASERLVALRNKLGLSQRALAQQFRVRNSAVSQWESGKREIPGPILALIEVYEREHEQGKRARQDSLKKISSSPLSRAATSSRLATQTFGAMASQSLASLVMTLEESEKRKRLVEEKLSRSIVEQLGQHKGLLMKIGQAMSYMNFALSDESRQLFAELQIASTAMDSKIIENQIEKELGAPPSQLFAKWEQTPISSASIGQVHRAQLKDGTPVAVKVQYPGVEKAIKADLSSAALVELLVTLLYRRQTTGTLVKELKERVLEECDYRREMENQMEFHRIFKNETEFYIPRVFEKFTSKSVITMEFAEGDLLEEFLIDAKQEDLNKAGERLYRFTYDAIFQHRIFNCDPHPGNYLFSPEHVTFLNFGCVKKFKASTLEQWRELAKAVIQNKEKRIDDLTVEMGLVSNTAEFDFDYHRKILRLFYQPVLEGRPFQFTPEFVEKTWRLFLKENPNKTCMHLPADWLFTNRLQWGLFSILSSLRASVPCREIFLKSLG